MAYKKRKNAKNEHSLKSTSWLPKLVCEGLGDAVEDCENEGQKFDTLSNMWTTKKKSIVPVKESKVDTENTLQEHQALNKMEANSAIIPSIRTSVSHLNGSAPRNYPPAYMPSSSGRITSRNGKFRLASSHPLLRRKIIPLPPTQLDASANHRPSDRNTFGRSNKFNASTEERHINGRNHFEIIRNSNKHFSRKAWPIMEQ